MLHGGECVSAGSGTIHVVTGVSGADFSKVNSVQPKWIEYAQNTAHGYLRAQVRDHVLQLRFVNAADRTIMDQVDIPSRFGGAKAKPITVDEAERIIDEQNESIYAF